MNRLKNPFLASSLVMAGIILLMFIFYFSMGASGPQPITISGGKAQQFQCSNPNHALTEWSKITLPHWEIGLETMFPNQFPNGAE